MSRCEKTSLPARRSGRRSAPWIAVLVLAAGSLAAQDTWIPRSRGPMPVVRLGSAGGPAPRDARRSTATWGIDAATRQRIDRALEFLYRSQSPEGCWTDRIGRKVQDTYRGHVGPHVGVTALAGMAFLSSGTLPGAGARKRYCVAVRRALEFIVAHCEPNGFITAGGSRMYSHAFATLFLAEAYGTGLFPDTQRLRDCLKRATQLIVTAQNSTGGWRYLPGAQDADMSITVCQVFALRGARNVGIDVPKATIDRAVRYVKESFVPERGSRGVFQYQIDPDYPGALSRYSFALTACGVATLCGAGDYNAVEVRKGLEYLWAMCPPAEVIPDRFDLLYAHYYAAQAAFQASGDFWRRWYEATKRDLLSLQQPDGSWTDLVGSNYATAMAAIVLQLPNQYLPIMEN